MATNKILETAMNAIILYDEPECAAAANEMLSRAARRSDEGLRWVVKPWRLDMLLAPSTASVALKDAAEAHLIVLALHSQAELSTRVFDWLEQWADRRKVLDAALAVWEGSEGDTLAETATPQLSRFAERHGLSFIFGDVSPAANETPVVTLGLHERELAVTPTREHVLQNEPSGSYQSWGINE